MSGSINIFIFSVVAICILWWATTISEKQQQHNKKLSFLGDSGLAGKVPSIYPLNPRRHPLDGLMQTTTVPKFDPLVRHRPYLPYGHLRKKFDMSSLVGERSTSIEQVGVISGFGSDQTRATPASSLASMVRSSNVVNMRKPSMNIGTSLGSYTTSMNTPKVRDRDAGKLNNRVQMPFFAV